METGTKPLVSKLLCCLYVGQTSVNVSMIRTSPSLRSSSRHCPAEGDDDCGRHHQSPIDLRRNRAIEGNAMENQCLDDHWMSYHDSTCNFRELQAKNAFSIERHALKIVQPLTEVNDNQYQLDCGGTDRFGRI